MDIQISKDKSVIELNNSVKMPVIGLGTFEMDSEYLTLHENVKSAIKHGYRLIDTAIMYGNQFFVGSAVSESIQENLVKREDLFITTKYWNNLDSLPEEQIQNALMELNVEYIDLVLVHQPFGFLDKDGYSKQRPLFQVWKNLEECVKKGIVKSIGVSNFNIQLLLDLLSYCEIKPAVNQIEVHPFLVQQNLIEFCKKYTIHVQAFTPLAQLKDISTNDVLLNLSKKYNKTVPQIVLNWHIQRGLSVIPKSFNEQRQLENFQSLNFNLSQEEVQQINNLNSNKRINDPLKDPYMFGIHALFD